MGMTTKEAVYEALRKANGDFVSGEALSKEAGVSRAAVWKAVGALIQDGYKIEGVSSRGYRLLASDVFNARSLRSELSLIPFFFYEEIDSTNNEAKRLLSNGQRAPFTVIAAKQSGGRGRRGRSFISAEGGIYLSIVLPTEKALNLESVTTASAIGVARLLEELGFEPQIKWVNDIYIKGKKAVGILTEGVVSFEDNSIAELIIGIGVNFSTKAFPEDIKDTSVSLYEETPSISRAEFAAREIESVISALNDETYINEYREKCFVIGKEINVIKVNGIKKAKALDVDERAHLIVQYEDGEIEHLSSGDITIRIR